MLDFEPSDNVARTEDVLEMKKYANKRYRRIFLSSRLIEVLDSRDPFGKCSWMARESKGQKR